MRYISVFSGIEAASAAWGPLGWEAVAFSEIEPFPCAVLRYRFPDVPNLGDITEVDWSPYSGAVDVVVGGSPCQSFSVAGRREGLDGESRLMYEYIRCVQDVSPRWLLWENVPGVLSIDAGRAFGILLHELAELGYSLAWRVLDAQFFKLAQRRRRVFLVGHLGGGCAPAAVLFESESVPGNTGSGGEKRQELAARAGIGASVSGFKWHQGTGAGGLGLEVEQAPTLTADYHNPAVIGAALGFSWHNGGKTGLSLGDASPCIGSRMQPAIAFAQNSRDEVRLQGGGDISGALSASAGMKQTAYVMLTSNTSANGSNVSEDVAYTLDRSSSNAVMCMGTGQANAGIMEDSSPTLTAAHEQPIVFSDTVGSLCASDSKGIGNQYVDCGKVVGSSHGGGPVLRRLTPVECERLQGFDDGWTDIPYKGRDHPPDSPRYRAIGNSMAVPVMRWIGERIEMVDGILEET